MPKPEPHGPNQQSTTSSVEYCGAEVNWFLGEHNPATPFKHPCDCSPKHSSAEDCHACWCTACTIELGRFRNSVGQ